MRQMPIKLQIQKINRAIVEAGHDPESFDVIAHVDSNLSYPENLRNIRKILNISRSKRNPQQISHEYCNHLSNECEIKCHKRACNQFKREKCPGEAEPCAAKERVCPIPVSGYCRDKSIRIVKKKEVPAKAFCVANYKRKCR